MFKKLIGIFLVTFLLLGSAMPMAMAAEAPTLALLQSVARNSDSGVAKEMCMNDSYIFVSYGTYVEVYSYDKNDPEVAPVYMTQISYGNGSSGGAPVPMRAYSMETAERHGKQYLLVGFVDTASGNASYPRLNIYDVSSIEPGATLEYSAQICMKAHTVGCEISVQDGLVYLVEWQTGTSTDAHLWTFSLERAFQAYNDYSSQGQAVDHQNEIVDSKQAKVGTLVTSACVDGNYVYLAKRTGLVVFEVTRTKTTNEDGSEKTTTSFNRKGQTYWDADKTSYTSSTIAAQGDYVYVSYAQSGTGKGGVQVWDVSATKASTTHGPSDNWSFDDAGLTPSTYLDNIYWKSQGSVVAVNGITVNGEYLYVSYPEMDRIAVYNISDITDGSAETAFDFTTPNNEYLAGINLGNIADRTSPAKTYANGGSHKMILVDDVLYFTDQKFGFKTARVSPKHQVGELTVSDGTETVTTLADGDLTSKITITNTSSVPYSGVMILAYYKGDTLEAVETKEVMVPAGQMDYELTSDAITVSGAEAGDSVKAMLWFDTTSTLKPLTGAVTISVPDAE